jgi:hypothetical protein
MKSKEMTRYGHAARIDKRKGAYRLIVSKPEGKRPLVSRRWHDNIKKY